MTCHEVIEYMQRQLDGELDEQEAEVLLSHTRQCPDCAEMFERLTRLSAELENLPRITPSYSLVDAILPRLEQIELMQASSQAIDPPAAALLPGRTATGKRTWLQRYSWLSGVVAASLVVGLFIVTYQSFDGLRSADKHNTSAEAQMLSSSANISASDELQTKTKNSSPTESDNTEPVQELYSAADNNGSSDAGDMSVTPPSTVTPTTKPGSGKEHEPVTPSSDSSAPDAPSAPAVQEEPQADVSNPYNSFDVHEDIAGDEGVSSSAADMGAERNGYMGLADEEESASNERSMTERAFTEEPERSVVAPSLHLADSFSPDGAYQAVIVGQALQIYAMEQGTLLFESESKDGPLMNVIWSKDSKTLVYEVMLPDEKQNIRYLVNVHEGTETKQ